MNSEQQHAEIARDRSQLRRLREHRESLIRKRELAEKLRQQNVKAIQSQGDPASEEERIQAAEARYARETAGIDADLNRTEDRIQEIRWRIEKTAGRILLADDEKNIRLTVSRALEPLGMPIETASDGEEALRKLEGEGFSLLLLDLKMPGMGGMEVLETVRRRWPSVLVVILTAYGNIDIAVDAMKMGAADFIQKPFNPLEIRELTTRVLQRGHLPPPAGESPSS